MCGRMWTHTQADGIDISGYTEAHTGRWDVTQMQLTQADGAQRPTQGRWWWLPGWCWCSHSGIIMCGYGRSHGLGRSHGQMRHASIIREHLRLASKRKITMSLIVKQVMVDASAVLHADKCSAGLFWQSCANDIDIWDSLASFNFIWEVDSHTKGSKTFKAQLPCRDQSELPPAPSSHPRIPDSSTCLSLPLACALSRLRSNW